MDGIRPGACMLWKPTTHGASALVTVIAMDLEKDRAQVHVTRASTQTCAAHWVDLSQLSEAPQGSCACACVAKTTQGNDAA